MTDPAVAIPLHFSLEFLGVAAFGGVLAWAAHRRAVVLAMGTALLFISQVMHAGQFVTGEADVVVLGFRLVGLVGMAVGVRFEMGKARPEPQFSAAAVAAGVPGLAWGTGLAALAVGAGHRELPDRGLWVSGWALLAGAEFWLAAVPPSAGLLADDLGLHLVRAAGFVAVGFWTARRTTTSLRLRVIGAFTLVLFIVVVVAGGAIARVGAADREADELRRLEVEAQTEQVAFARTTTDAMRNAAVVSQSFAPVVGDPDRVNDVARIMLEQVFPELDLVVLVDPAGAIIGGRGLREGEDAAVTQTPALAAALDGEPAADAEHGPDGVLALGFAPVYQQGAPRTAENIVAAVVAGQRFDDDAVRNIGRRLGSPVLLLSPGGEVIASSETVLIRRADVPVEALRTVADGRTWNGSIATDEGRFLAGAAPAAAPGQAVPASFLIARPDTALAGTALDVSRALLGAILAAALMAVIIALWLSSRIVRPVLELTDTARRVEEGDLDARSHVRTVDEIGTLAGAFDSMTTTLRSTLASEQEARGELEAIVAGMGEGLAAVDADFNIVSFNPAAEGICGVAADDAVGAKCYDVYGHLTRGPEGKPICDYICPLRHDGGVDGGVVLETADGDIRSVAVTCSALRDPEGNLVGGVDLLRDVTSEMQAEQMKSNFLANISHELRTPLAPILGYAQIMRRKKVSTDQRDRFLDEIVSSTQRLERIVTILVDVAALESGRLQVDPAPVSAEHLVRSAVQRWEGRTPNHKLKATLPASLPEVEADAELVGRVIDELIDNAVKFAPDGGPITVKARATRGGVELSVSDKGIGMDADALERLADEFVQADPTQTRQFGGLGVGLAFVRRIVEAHGGRLEASSAPKKGTTFSFVLPRAAQSRSKKAAAKPGSKKAAKTSRVRARKS